jgi:poly-gamma-glutamate capsule biosynthesis protein CapA/YwtB (metallophosphatase superfamily)
MSVRPFLSVLLGAGIIGTTALAQAPLGTDAGHFTLALTGDSIITRRLSVYEEPEFLAMIELLRSADAAFTNLEMLFHDYEPFPMHESGGTYMRAEPALVEELVWAGFDLVSRANNHTGDYGVLGQRLTTRYVEAAGLVHAGTGEGLRQAREPRFLETARGRVALVSVAATFPEQSRAGETFGDNPSRPGLAPQRYSTTQIVTAEQMEHFRVVLQELGVRVPEEGTSLRAFGTRFEVGPERGSRTEPHPGDLEANVVSVHSGSRLSDCTIVSIHAHESGGRSTVPAGFTETFARAMIDAGADVVVGHGPHVLRGIEIYNGRPIFYSLGDFIFQNETLLRLPAENYEPYGLIPDEATVAEFNRRRYRDDRSGFPANREIWESVVAWLEWEGEQVAAIRLYPITLGFGLPPARRGRPMFATGELAAKILNDLVERSAPYGTTIRIEDGVGVVVLR